MRSTNFGAWTSLVVAAGLLFSGGVQASLAAVRPIDAYTTDKGGRVVMTLDWEGRNNSYSGHVIGTVFERKPDKAHCALAQVSLDGKLYSIGEACPNVRQKGFDFPFKQTRQVLARVCMGSTASGPLGKGGRLSNCSEWK